MFYQNPRIPVISQSTNSHVYYLIQLKLKKDNFLKQNMPTVNHATFNSFPFQFWSDILLLTQATSDALAQIMMSL